MYDVSATFHKRQVLIEGNHPIDLYCVNASLSGYEPLYYANINQDIYGFSVNATGEITSNATIYTGLPIKRGEIGSNNTGEIGELTLSIPNTDRLIESIIQNKQYLRGREIYAMSLFAYNLPSGATEKHLGTEPDKNAIMKEKMYIDAVSSNEQAVTFSCKSKFTIKKIVIPRRKYMRECFWALDDKYAATECDPQNIVNTASYPTCDGTLENCRKRGNDARYGGFTSIPRNAYIIL